MNIGALNRLKIARFTPQGAYLEDREGNDVLLPTKYVPPNIKVGAELEVFVYRDSEDRMIATTLKPHIEINQFGYLRVKDVNKFGAFLDWGIEKDLMVPFREQIGKMQKGSSYLVYLYLDSKTKRLVATQKVQSRFESAEIDLKVGEEVNLLIAGDTELGINVVINNRYKGLVFSNEIFTDLLPGDRTKGYIKNIRPDKKIDVSLQKVGLEHLEAGAASIYQALESNKGFLALTDKSSPEEIQFHLQMSKKTFKRSLGILYKKRLVKLVDDGIKKL